MLGAGYAKTLGVGTGDDVTVVSEVGSWTVRLVGIVAQPQSGGGGRRAEAILIGLVVCALGLAFGVMAGWCGTGMARYLSPFGGMSTPLVLPWARLALGVSAALGLCLLAALWPALAAGRTEPLRLLQAGRAST